MLNCMHTLQGTTFKSLFRHHDRCNKAGAVQALARPPQLCLSRRNCCNTRAERQVGASKPTWAARLPTWSPSTRKQMNHLMDLFTIADKDGNGILDRDEVRYLLQSDGRCTSGICMMAQNRWVSDADIDEIMALYDSGAKGGLTFTEFMELTLDGVLLDGTMDEYRAVFAAADEDGDGSLCLEEMAAVLQQLGRPISPQEVQQVMASADLDGNARIDFNEWLRLFRGQLLDLPRLLRYMKMKPVVLGDEASLVGESQLQAVMASLPPGTLLVAMFGLSGDNVCIKTGQEVQELAAVYRQAVFLAVHVDASPEAKTLFKHVLLGRYVPAFYFFRGGQLLHSHADASVAVLERHLREHLPATEQPLQPLLQQDSKQKQQASSAADDPRQVPVAGYSLADLVYDHTLK